jgi:transposase-like protein
MSEYKPCPKCGAQHPLEVGFTWWGGIVGPKMFSHVQCKQCGNTYNGKTGASNQKAITIYVTVSSLVGLLLVAVLYSNRNSSSPTNATSSIGIDRQQSC